MSIIIMCIVHNKSKSPSNDDHAAGVKDRTTDHRTYLKELHTDRWKGWSRLQISFVSKRLPNLLRMELRQLSKQEEMERRKVEERRRSGKKNFESIIFQSKIFINAIEIIYCFLFFKLQMIVIRYIALIFKREATFTDYFVRHPSVRTNNI